MATWLITPLLPSNIIRSPGSSWSMYGGTARPALAIWREVLGSSIPFFRYANWMNPEQSNPDGVVPPQRYGTPTYCSPVRIAAAAVALDDPVVRDPDEVRPAVRPDVRPDVRPLDLAVPDGDRPALEMSEIVLAIRTARSTFPRLISAILNWAFATDETTDDARASINKHARMVRLLFEIKSMKAGHEPFGAVKANLLPAQALRAFTEYFDRFIRPTGMTIAVLPYARETRETIYCRN